MMIPAAAQATQTDPLLVAIVSVALTLIVGVAVGIVTAVLSRNGEHEKWMRERRYEAYVAFMIDMNAQTSLIGTKTTIANASKVKARVERISEKSVASFEAVSLLGPRIVNAAGQHWVWSASEYAKSQGRPEASALDAARWNFLVVAGEVLKSDNVTTVPMPNPSPVPSSDYAPVSS